MNARFAFLGVASLLVFTTSCRLPYLHPGELGLGDQYHLVFVTSGTRNATSSSLSDYNSFVQSQAQSSSLALPTATWKAIASTQTENAIMNVGSTSGPVYLVDASTVVSNSIANLFDGSNLLAPINTTQNGNVVSSFNYTWTGTAPGGVSSDNPLGSTEPQRGDLRATDGQLWLTANNSLLSSSGQPFYAISGPITVTSLNPLPGIWSLVKWGAAAILGIVVLTPRRE